MNTVQRYSGKGNYVSLTSPTAQNAASTPPLADNRQLTPPLSPAEFITQHPELIGLPADELDDQLRELLLDHRVGYSSPQDGITFLTGFLPELASSVDAHYALLLRGGTIISLVCVNLNHSLPEAEVAESLSLDDIDGRYLISRSVDVGATGLLLISTRNGRAQCNLDSTERAFITKLQQSLEVMSVDVEDWLLVIDERVVSCLTSPIAAAAAPVSVEAFITQHSGLIGLPPAELASQLTERLQSGPVHYATVLDGIALLRAFMPNVEDYPNANYALLFRGWTIIGLAYLPNASGESSHPIATHESDNRNLMRHILALDADKVLLATRLAEEETIDDQWFREVSAIRTTAMWYGYEHLDWLMLLPTENVSYVLEDMGEAMLDGGVTYEQLTGHYIDFSGNAAPSTAC